MYGSIITDQISDHLSEAIPIIKKEGYTSVELHNIDDKSIEELNEEEARQVHAMLEEAGLSVSCLSSTIFFLCPLYEDNKVSLFNPHFHAIRGDVSKHLEYLRQACHTAHILNCRRIRLFPFRFPDQKKPPFGTEEDIERIITFARRAVRIAAEEDIELVMENCPYSYLPRGRMTLRVIQAVDSPFLKLLWDPANAYRAVTDNLPDEYRNGSLNEELEKIYPYIGHVHVKNYHYVTGLAKPFVHVPLAEGDIDFSSLLNNLNEKKYEGAVSLEAETDREGTILSMRSLRQILFRYS
jgi:sugar phosphate isomerase/epimerase